MGEAKTARSFQGVLAFEPRGEKRMDFYSQFSDEQIYKLQALMLSDIENLKAIIPNCQPENRQSMADLLAYTERRLLLINDDIVRREGAKGYKTH